MTKKKHEELVEEIAEKIIGYYDGSPVVAEEDREISRGIITLILSAVRDGRLGLEEGAIETRIEMSDESSLRFLSAWIKELARDGYRRFIALRPLAGTGKEEE